MKPLIFVLISIHCSTALYAQENDSIRSYTTTHLTGEPPQIDGVLNDAAWEQVPWGGDGFRQREPGAGTPASAITKFKILYDAKNLYIAFKCFDPEPDKIVRRMSRRDGFDGDFVEINIDSYYDKRSAFSFTSSVSGVKGDEYVSNNGNNWDANWDPIWYLKTSIDTEGWIAEVRIPLSQLRFGDKEEHIWGIQVMRHFFRNQERSVWQYIPPGSPGWVHLFGELRGIKGIKPQKQLEIQPYVVAKTEKFEKQEGNPFATGKSSDVDFGLDAKIGLTSDITLDLTVNPDFGQVEADPSQVNLSAFQLFFSERRPFFIEGRNTLNFPISESVAGGNFNSDNLFYSRRIGRRPVYYPNLNGDEYADVPVNTKIIGAAKLTGKSKNGFSWGLLESVTAKTEAEIDSLGERRKETVEPRTNYLVARAQQDINKGNTIIGAMFTATNRNIEDPHLEFLHKDAYTGGIDFIHNWKDRKYYFRFNGIFSHVQGTKEAITRTQLANEHLFQRPNASYINVDSSRTSLTGTCGTVAVGKSTGNIVFQTGVTWRSPELELNDIGFLISSDLITQWGWAQYRILKPFSIFRSMRINGNEWLYYDYDGTNTRRMINFNGHVQFKNYWFMGGGGTLIDRRISNADLRGGPPITYPGGLENFYYIESDNRKKIRFSFENWFFTGFKNSERSKGISASITFRPINAMNISLAPGIDFNGNRQQYVETTNFGNEDRYITARINQKTYSMTIRVNYVLTPNLTIEYWGQPFISTGEYSEFKRITEASAENYNDRFHTFSNNEISFNSISGQYDIDENADNNVDYSINNPDFNFAQLRSNMVVRWEYIPGSTLFLVWTQNKTDFVPVGESNSFRNLSSSLFDKNAHNIFLIKYTYRFRL
jgi:hypothetical protein